MIIYGFSSRLISAVNEKNLNLKELSDKTGFDYRSVWRYAHDERTPPSLFVARASVALGVTSDWLLGCSGDNKKYRN